MCECWVFQLCHLVTDRLPQGHVKDTLVTCVVFSKHQSKQIHTLIYR